jgi:hypothetical protein
MASSTLNKFSVPLESDNGSDTEGTLMPKLKYRFRITFTGFGAESADTTEITKQVSEAARPNVEFENKVIEVYNSKINYAGKPTWKPISVKIRDNATGEVTKLVGQQNQKQFDFYEQSSAASGGDYKFKMTIEMLDGGNGSNGATVLEAWECYGCYIQSTQYNALSYGDAAYMTIDLMIQPDNCVQLSEYGEGIGYESTDRPADTGYATI